MYTRSLRKYVNLDVIQNYLTAFPGSSFYIHSEMQLRFHYIAQMQRLR